MARHLLAIAAVLLALPSTAAAVEPFRPAGVTSADGAVAVAEAAIDQRPALFDDAATAELEVSKTTRGPANVTVVRLEQQIDGVPVLGGEVVVAVDDRKRVVAGSGELLQGPAPDVHPALSAAAARSIALRELGLAHGPGLTASDPVLTVFDPTLFGGPGLPGGTLVWDMEVEREPGLRHRVLVDADSGAIALDLDELAGARDRYVCDAGNSVAVTTAIGICGAGSVQLARGEGGAAVALDDVNRAYDYAGTTYDFYLDLGRDSIDGAGMPIASTVRGCRSGSTCPMDNAYWSDNRMVYGTGFAAAEDVVAHELTHGVTEYESNLLYWMQSGAISESLSDVFGEFVDLTYGGDGQTSRWLIGEDLPASIGVIRDMANPPAKGDPDSTDSARYYTGTADNGGVHWNSGVGNKAAYLMVDGGTFGGRTVTGLGIPKAARVWYQAARLLRSGASYADLAVALQDGCATLVGTSGITAADCTEVGDAVAAVKMATPPPAAPVPQAPVCSSGTLRTVWGDSFETGHGGWTAGAESGESIWYASATYTGYAYAASGAHNVFAWDGPGANDAWLQMNADRVVPAGGYLRFSHGWDFNVDGGTVEYSTDGGGTWRDITVLGTPDQGYNGSIATTQDNPREGVAAFVGNSNGLTSTRISLAPIAGQSVRVRFRFANDSVTARRKGWYVDDVVLYACDAAATTDTTVTVVRAAPAWPADGTVQMVPSGQTPGTGDVVCGVGDAACAVPSSAGSFVTLRAVPGEASAFGGWSGACTGTSPTCVVTATQANAVTASFAYTGPTPSAVTSFTPVTASPTTATSLAFRIAFDEEVSGLTAGDFDAGLTGTLACGTPTVAGSGGSASVYDITWAGCTGTGTIRPTLAVNAVLDDRSTAGPTGTAQAAEAVSRVNPTPPAVVSFTRTGASPTTSTSPGFRLAFDEDVTGIDAADFTATETGALSCAIAGVSAVSARVYDITAACQGEGTLTLRLAANRARDALGTAGPTTSTTSEATEVDTTPAPPAVSPAAGATDPEADGGTGPAAEPVAPTLRAAAVAWRTTGRSVAPTFAASADTTYRITAVRVGKGAPAKGRCAVVGANAQCRISLARGSWRVSITPMRDGIAGKPVVRPVRIR